MFSNKVFIYCLVFTWEYNLYQKYWCLEYGEIVSAGNENHEDLLLDLTHNISPTYQAREARLDKYK